MRSILALLLVLSLSAVADTAPGTLTWDRNPEPDVERYEVQIGTAPGVHDHVYQVTDGTVQQTVTLDIGVFYYAVVVAIDTSGQRSGPSNELCFQVFAPGQGIPPKAPTGLRKTTIRITLLSSPDLRVWTPEDAWDFSTDLPALFFKLAAQ